MEAPNGHSSTDRRRRANHYLSILVDLGVTYRRALGEASALAFYADHGVPEDLAGRVLGRNSSRRLTGWEADARNERRDLELKT